MDRSEIPTEEEALIALKKLRLWASEYYIVESCFANHDPECVSCRLIQSFNQMERELHATLGIVPAPHIIGLTYAELPDEEIFDDDFEPEETFHVESWAQWKGDGPMPKSWEAVSPEGVTTKVYRSYQDYCAATYTEKYHGRD